MKMFLSLRDLKNLKTPPVYFVWTAGLELASERIKSTGGLFMNLLFVKQYYLFPYIPLVF